MKPVKYDVVVIGELNPDLILSGNVVPEFGQAEKIIGNAALTIGSSSAIFACGAARLGLNVAFIGKVGNDLFGRFICQSLSSYGIDISGIVLDEKVPTGVSIILSNGADRAILTALGTIPSLKYADIDLEIIKRSRHLHVGSYYLQQSLRPDIPILFDFAHGNGMSISLDTNFDPDKKWRDDLEHVLEKVDIFLPNTTECCEIAGRSNFEQAVEYLRKKVQYLVVKLGANGALLCLNQEIISVEPIPVNVVDTVGAGDSFDAGFIYGYLAGWTPERALKFATICGGLSTRKTGGTEAQPALEEAMQYL
jgi:sugar/nucleoside kinase (ribokinase family)